MSIESLEDRKAFVDIFGTPAIVGGVSVNAIFDNASVEILDVSSTAPMITVVSSDLPDVEQGQAVTVSEFSFSGKIIDIQPDGTGMISLLLGSS